jgi:hypothetical protein
MPGNHQGGFMRRFPLAVVAALCLSPMLAFGQQASSAETRAVAAIGQCLLEGLPEGWKQAHVIVELPQPGADTGDVRYLVALEDSPAEELEPFTPCNAKEPARRLMDARSALPSPRRDWTTLKLVLNNDGKFSLSYVYLK